MSPSTEHTWPALPLEEWQDTYATAHRLLQIVGKTRLQFSPPENHWWHTALYLTARGIGTSPMSDGSTEFDVELDFVDHVLRVRRNDGVTRSIELKARSVASFYREYAEAFKSLGIDLHIWPVPMEMSDTLRFDEDETHRSYDADAMHRCWRALSHADRILKIHRGDFLGKSSPSHLWWGGFDLSCTRFSGRRAPKHPGGVPNLPDFITWEAYSHECISVGWWPGNIGTVEEPAFYAYAYPVPPGCADAVIEAEGVYYHLQMGLWILPYETVRASRHPDALVKQFCQNTYEAAAELSNWDRGALER